MRGSFDFIFTLWLNTAELVKGGGMYVIVGLCVKEYITAN